MKKHIRMTPSTFKANITKTCNRMVKEYTRVPSTSMVLNRLNLYNTFETDNNGKEWIYIKGNYIELIQNYIKENFKEYKREDKQIKNDE